MKQFFNINHNYVIDLIHLSKEDNYVIYDFQVRGDIQRYFHTNRLWIEFPFLISDIPDSVLSIPFIATTMSLAWITGSIIHVDKVDDTLYNQFSVVRQKFQEMYPTLNLGGSLYADEIVENKATLATSTEACLFSGGIDAITTFVRHKDSIRYLIYTNGLISALDTNDEVYNHETKIISDFADCYNVNPIFVRSNFFYFIKQSLLSANYRKHFSGFWHDMYHSMAFIGVASVACYKYNISRLYIGSSNTIDPWHPCASDPTTDTALSFLNTRVSHDAFGLNRQDKTHIIVEEKRLLGTDYPLHVCSFNDHNCCKCEKCLRTMWGLIAENEDPREYGFNIEGNLSDFIRQSVEENIGLMGFDLERKIYWPHIKREMKKNYDMMTPELQSSVDWFLTFDFRSAKKHGVLKYYRQNFFSILKRKLHIG